MKKTKIVCTIGPASQDKDTLREVIKEGMNVMRLNFSHGDHEEQYGKVKTLRELNEELGTHVAILLDTKGPEIRTHCFEEGKIEVTKGDTIRVSMKEVLGTKEMFSITYSGLINDVKVGNTILVDDGKVELRVTGFEEDAIVTEIVNSGVIKNKRGINVPNVNLHFEFISDLDRASIGFACEHKVDFIAASFVRRASDVEEIRAILKEYGNTHIQIIAKIENEEGVSNIEEILEVSDGIMVARGDLGVEVPLEEVPLIQKNIVKLCNAKHKPVVVATQMLDSMQDNPRPTRAEVSDVTNAVIDGADAIMLSGETASGDYPVETVRTMYKIARYAEQKITATCNDYTERANKTSEANFRNAIASSAVHAAKMLNAKVIIASTESGNSAKAISTFRSCCPVVAATPSAEVARSLGLSFGIYPMTTDHYSSVEELVLDNIAEIKEMFKLESGDNVIITGGFKENKEGTTNSLRLETID